MLENQCGQMKGGADPAVSRSPLSFFAHSPEDSLSSRGTEAHSWNLQNGIDPDDRHQVTPFIRLIQQTISLGCILAKYGGQCCDRKYTDLPLLVPLLNNDAIPELTFGDPDHHEGWFILNGASPGYPLIGL